jgi:hypothetical protein
VKVDEALTKWCPFARVRGNGNTSVNRFPDDDATADQVGVRCIGPACMAWRWFYEPGQHTDGHCGLAGPGGPS